MSIHLQIQSVNNYLLSTYRVPKVVLTCFGTLNEQNRQSPDPHGVCVGVRGETGDNEESNSPLESLLEKGKYCGRDAKISVG